jgi:uncharacterized membrane protein
LSAPVDARWRAPDAAAAGSTAGGTVSGVSRWRPIVATLVCLAGDGMAGFLTWAHYFDQAAINSSCPLGGSGMVNCGAVTTSPESMILGLPVALYGLVYLVVMTVLCLPVAWRSPSPLVARSRLTLAIAGMGFVLYLVSVELLELRLICLECTSVHVLQFVLFLLVVTGWDGTGYAASLTAAGPTAA